jgi:hypothetical protein
LSGVSANAANKLTGLPFFSCTTCALLSTKISHSSELVMEGSAGFRTSASGVGILVTYMGRETWFAATVKTIWKAMRDVVKDCIHASKRARSGTSRRRVRLAGAAQTIDKLPAFVTSRRDGWMHQRHLTVSLPSLSSTVIPLVTMYRTVHFAILRNGQHSVRHIQGYTTCTHAKKKSPIAA